MLITEIKNDIDKYIAETLNEIKLKQLIDQEFMSYGNSEYKPLTSDDLVVQKAIEMIREHFSQEFAKVHEIIEEQIQIALNQQNFSEEERKEKHDYLWQTIKIKPQISEDGRYQVTVDFKE